MAAAGIAASAGGRFRAPLILGTMLGTLAITAVETGIGVARMRGVVDGTTIATGSVLWSAYASVGMLGAVMLGRRMRHSVSLATAFPLGLAALALLVTNMHILQDAPGLLFLNPHFLLMASVPVLFAVASGGIRGSGVLGAQEENRARRSLALVALTLPLGLLSVEVAGFFEREQGRQFVNAALSVTWTAYAAILLGSGMLRKMAALRRAGLVLLGLTLTKVALIDLSSLEDIYRIVSFIALGAALMAGAWLYHRFDSRMFGDAARKLTTEATDAQSSA